MRKKKPGNSFPGNFFSIHGLRFNDFVLWKYHKRSAGGVVWCCVVGGGSQTLNEEIA